MGTTVREEFERRLVPAGVHRATCCWVIDLGTQVSFYQGHAKEQAKVLIGWELADVRVTIPASEKGPERTFLQKVSNTYTASLDSRAILRQHLDAWRGRPFTAEELKKGFSLKAILGSSCLIQIMHEDKGGKVYANITAIMAMAPGMEKPKREAPIAYFDMDARTPLPEGLPSWITEKIYKSPEWQGRYESFDPATMAQDPEQAPAEPAAAAADAGAGDQVGDSMTGLEEAVTEGEIRKLATALGKGGTALEVRIGTAKRRGTLRELLDTFVEMAELAGVKA